jgi:cytoskeletal protein CcmA (bactofilin family)
VKFYKVKAGALQFAIMISAIIAVLLSVFIVLVHSHSLFEKKSDLLIETIQQAENVMLAEIHDFSVERDTIFSVIDEERNMYSILHKSYWGMYGKVYSQTETKGKAFEKMALVSGWQSDVDRTALYLKETNRPLIVVGNTKIQGKTYLPARGIRAGTISGNSYYGSNLVYGTILKSKEMLPKLPQQLRNYLASLQRMPLPRDDEYYINLKPGKTYTNSFTAPVKTVFSNGELEVFGVKLIGNIIVRSNTKIKIAASTTLKDVILIAPEIEVEANTKGTFQAIASKQILVGKNCELSYPSSLVMLAKDELEETPDQEKKKHIFIDEHTTVKGMVCYLQSETNNRFEPQILLKENTTLEGFLYCEQQLELLGNVHGSVYTSGFITKQFGSVYQNHIYNGVISSTQLMNEYVGFPFENLDYKVAKWLY